MKYARTGLHIIDPTYFVPLEKFQEKTAALIAASNPNQFELWMQISAGKFPFGAAIFS